MPKTESLPNLEERVPATQDDLPDLTGYRWLPRRITEYDCGTKAIGTFKVGQDQERTPGRDCFVYVTEGVNTYLDTHGVKEIEVPRYYTRFRVKFDTYVSEWTIGKYGVGVGITSYLLESAVRLANGKGHIDHDATTAVICDNYTFLVTGPRGVFIVDQMSIRTSHLSNSREPPAEVFNKIPGTEIRVPEESEVILNGLARFIDAVETYLDVPIESAERPSDDRHTLITESGQRMFASAGRLELFAKMKTDQSDLHGTYSHLLNEEEYTSTVDSNAFSHERGDRTNQGVVVGYLHNWETDEYIMGDDIAGLRSEVTYVCMAHRPEKYCHNDIQITQLRETVDSWEFNG